jgi:hypothetical protein
VEETKSEDLDVDVRIILKWIWGGEMVLEVEDWIHAV